MIVSGRLEEWVEIWGAIKDETQTSSERMITIIHSIHEVETVCAVKLLQVALQINQTSFSTYPVENEGRLQKVLNDVLFDSTDFRTVILINCGASCFVKDLAPEASKNVRYIVIDSHRPIHPSYNDTSDLDVLLVLAEDDPLPQHEVPAVCELDLMTQQQREELEQQAQEEAEEEEMRGEMMDSPAKRQRRDEGAARRLRDRLLLLREREKQLDNYFDMGSSYGKPTPLVLLPLGEMLLNKTDNSLLWPAAVGLTDQLVHQRLSSQHYEAWYRQLADAVAAADANFTAQQQQHHQQQRHGRQSDRQSDGGSGKQQPASQPRVVADKDYRLMLFRHWTLFDAFCCSPYVAPRLQTWRPGGKEAVALLFANMGVSVEQAKTDYSSMQGRFRDLFSRQLEKALLKTSLSHRELAGDSFMLHHNRQTTSATDVVHACTALLSEYCVSDLQDQGRDPTSGFLRAQRALDCHTVLGWQALLEGIRDAKTLQQAIIMDGGNMVTDQKLKVNPGARMQELNLVALAPTNAAEFRHPLTLLRLAHFVRDATKIARQGGGLRAYNYPIMVIGPEDSAGWCIVIGLRSNLLANNAQYNIFGRTFQAVLEAEDSEVQWDQTRKCFDSSVVYIHRDSLVTFCSDVRAQLLSNAADAAAAAATNQQTQQQDRGGGSQPSAAGRRGSNGGSNGGSSGSPQGDKPAAAAGQPGEEEVEEEFSDVESLADTLASGGDGEADGLEGVDVVEASEEGDDGGGEADQD